MTQPSPQSGREHDVGILAASLLRFDFGTFGNIRKMWQKKKIGGRDKRRAFASQRVASILRPQFSAVRKEMLHRFNQIRWLIAALKRPASAADGALVRVHDAYGGDQ